MPFTKEELEITEAMVGFYTQALPHIERGELVSGEVQANMKLLVAGLDGSRMIIGSMEACEVAIKTLAKVTERALTRVGEEMDEILDRIKFVDALAYGERAYEDAKQCAVIMTEAMEGSGRGDFSVVFDMSDPKVELHAMRAWGALLVALIMMLAVLHGVSISEASRILALDLHTITPV